jgi:hypothetical protein
MHGKVLVYISSTKSKKIRPHVAQFPADRQWTDKPDEADSRALHLLRERAKKRSSLCELDAN